MAIANSYWTTSGTSTNVTSPYLDSLRGTRQYFDVERIIGHEVSRRVNQKAEELVTFKKKEVSIFPFRQNKYKSFLGSLQEDFDNWAGSIKRELFK